MRFAVAFVAAPAFSTLLTIASIGLGVAGVVASTSATIAANNYQAQVAQRNADLMMENAQNAIQASQAAQLQQDQQTRALLGEQLAVQSASGLRIGGKSQMMTRKSARELGRQDALTIRDAGEREAYNFKQLAEDSNAQVNFLHSSNQSALVSGFLDAASIGITGLRNVKGSQLQSMFGASKTKSIANSYKANTNLRFAR
jgi:hypothetical protein